jgi:ferric-dicitrate binding protein FerR (iron transport regulator)
LWCVYSSTGIDYRRHRNTARRNPNESTGEDGIFASVGGRPSLQMTSRICKVVAACASAIAGLVPLYQMFLNGPANSPPANELSHGHLSTKLGEYHCFVLADSSEACLNTDSLVKVDINSTARHIEVVSGEVSFVVHKDSRPFDVLAGSVLIHDVSTAFDVLKTRKSTQVTVVQGSIRVMAPVKIDSRIKFDLAQADDGWQRAPEYHRLQQIEFDEAAGTLRSRPALTETRLAQMLAWKKGRIDLNGRSLEEALSEFSRYQSVTRFKYADSSIGKIIVGGSMEFTNLDDFLQAVQHEFHVHYRITYVDGDQVVRLSRQRAAAVVK